MPFVEGTYRPSREPRHEMATVPAAERITNFTEVALGFDDATAVAEANRCLQCKNPTCEQGCPVNVRIKDFIGGIIEGNRCKAVSALRDRNALPAVCGRVCPQEKQCEASCILAKKGAPVAIGSLERYLADWDREQPAEQRCKITPKPRNGKKVAVIGAGPAGLACAGELSLRGYEATVFESLHTAGGVLAYGIPEFRLPKSILEDEVEALRTARVNFAFDHVVGRITDAEELLDEQGFSAVFIGTGAGLPQFLGIPGENYVGVYSANEFLTRANLMRAYEFPQADTPVRHGKHVAVIGGGNVAMDAARTALRLGAEEVTLVYRRTEAEMPARRAEIEHAKEEGVLIRELCSPLEIKGEEGTVTGLKVQRMRLGEPDASGRRRPEPLAGETLTLACDTLIVAIGTRANSTTRLVSNVELNERGYIKVDEKGATSDPRIFAGGDIITGAATVILAMGAGKQAARSIDAFLSKEEVR